MATALKTESQPKWWKRRTVYMLTDLKMIIYVKSVAFDHKERTNESILCTSVYKAEQFAKLDKVDRLIYVSGEGSLLQLVDTNVVLRIEDGVIIDAERNGTRENLRYHAKELHGSKCLMANTTMKSEIDNTMTDEIMNTIWKDLGLDLSMLPKKYIQKDKEAKKEEKAETLEKDKPTSKKNKKTAVRSEQQKLVDETDVINEEINDFAIERKVSTNENVKSDTFKKLVNILLKFGLNETSVTPCGVPTEIDSDDEMVRILASARSLIMESVNGIENIAGKMSSTRSKELIYLISPKDITSCIGTGKFVIHEGVRFAIMPETSL